MSSIVERARALHEDNEILKVRIVQDFIHRKSKTHRGDLLQQHRLRRTLDRIRENNEELVRIYRDEDRTFADELSQITPSMAFGPFYEQLRDIREYHRRHTLANEQPSMAPAQFNTMEGMQQQEGGAEQSGPTVALEAIEDDTLVSFSGEEKFGKYVDMTHLHERFVNLPIFKNQKRMDYVDYLARFQAPYPSCAGMSEYLDDLIEYLADFHGRIHPLYPIEKINRQIEEEFIAKKANDEENQHRTGRLHCQLCQKDFANESVLAAHLRSKKHLKKVDSLENGNHKNGAAVDSLRLKQYKVEIFADLLSDIIAATRQRVEVQQTRTFQEILTERAELSEEESESENEEDEEAVLYNPKNVPLGWDGKPIPYWLYKLHGLNIEYRCEICGDYAYMGPRNFERHFTEWRHVNGMKALKIPNSHHFKYVTKIEDALALFKKVKLMEKTREWHPENDEELEDRQGNVFKKKTFEDLKRQGII
ncbi:Matrin-type domain-containing protein [Plasmodiophora brassicae]